MRTTTPTEAQQRKNAQAAPPRATAFVSMKDGHDDRILLNAVYVNPACGCRIRGDGSCPFPLRIQFCEKHAT